MDRKLRRKINMFLERNMVSKWPALHPPFTTYTNTSRIKGIRDKRKEITLHRHYHHRPIINPMLDISIYQEAKLSPVFGSAHPAMGLLLYKTTHVGYLVA